MLCSLFIMTQKRDIPSSKNPKQPDVPVSRATHTALLSHLPALNSRRCTSRGDPKMSTTCRNRNRTENVAIRNKQKLGYNYPTPCSEAQTPRARTKTHCGAERGSLGSGMHSLDAKVIGLQYAVGNTFTIYSTQR